MLMEYKHQQSIKNRMLIIVLYLLCFAYIASYFDVAYDNFVLSYLKWIMLVISILALHIKIKLINPNNNREPMNSKAISMFFFIAALILTNLYLSMNGVTSLMTVVTLSLSCLFFLLLSKAIKLNIITIFEINKIIFTSIFIIVLISTILYLTEYMNFMQVLSGSGRYRIKGVFRHPNTLAMNCVVASIALFDNIRKKTHLTPKSSVVKYILLLFFIFQIIASDSNTAKYALFSFVLLYFFISKLEHKVSSLRALQLLSLITMIVAGLISLTNLLQHVDASDKSNSLGVRMSSWISILQSIGTDPIRLLFGFGLSGTGRYTDGSFQQLQLSVDNGYMTFLFQAGLIGLLLLLCYMVSVLMFIIFKPKKELDKHFVAIVFCCGFCLLLYSMFENLLIAMGNLITLYLWFRIFNFKFQINSQIKKQNERLLTSSWISRREVLK